MYDFLSAEHETVVFSGTYVLSKTSVLALHSSSTFKVAIVPYSESGNGRFPVQLKTCGILEELQIKTALECSVTVTFGDGLNDTLLVWTAFIPENKRTMYV